MTPSTRALEALSDRNQIAEEVTRMRAELQRMLQLLFDHEDKVTDIAEEEGGYVHKVSHNHWEYR